MPPDWRVFTCARTSDISILDRDLRRSPAIAKGDVDLTVLWNQPSASEAYANAMATTTAEIFIFAHCDVFFPDGWFERFEWEIARLTRLDPKWAVAGVIGVTAAGRYVGRVWDCSLAPLFSATNGIFGAELPEPERVVGFDELVLIVRKEAGVHFDPKLPGFHLYGTDIALEAERCGRTSYALDMPLIHNAKAQLQVGPDYVEAYQYMVRKWGKRLPVPTTCGVLTANPFVLPYRRMKVLYKARFKQSTFSTERLADPSIKAEELGLSRLLAGPMIDERPPSRQDDAGQATNSPASAAPDAAKAPGIENVAKTDPHQAEPAVAATSTDAYRVKIFRGREEIEPLRDFWAACHPDRDADLDFYLFVAEHIAGCLGPRALVLYQGDTPKALLAGRLDVSRIRIKAGYFTLPVPETKILRIVHGGVLGELNSETAPLLVSSIIDSLSAGEADAAMLEALPTNSPMAECARAMPSWLCSDRLTHRISHWKRDMAGAVGAFPAQLSSNARYQQRKRAAKLTSSFADVKIERFHSLDKLPDLMASADIIASKSYQRGLGVGFIREPFVEARLEFEARKNWLRGFVLSLDNQPCAYWIGSLRDGTFVSTYLAFDQTYSDYAPGMYLLLVAMEELCGDGSGAQMFDFGGGDAPYKERLSNKFIEEAEVYIFSPRLKPLTINALRSLIGKASDYVQHSETLTPHLLKLKRWLRSRAAKRA